jgi:hypothetical protein
LNSGGRIPREGGSSQEGEMGIRVRVARIQFIYKRYDGLFAG